ncbi:hypothetical protein O9993_00710 [Vibrio lentus]|nr:hypothetical protein [Vibrio lentus]
MITAMVLDQTDPSRLSDVQTPPEHYSGEITFNSNFNITDEADCVTETDTQDKRPWCDYHR